VQEIKKAELLRRELLREQTAELIAQAIPTKAEEVRFVSPAVLAAEWDRDANERGSQVGQPIVIDEELLKVRDRYVAAPRPSVYDRGGEAEETLIQRAVAEQPNFKEAEERDWAPKW